MLVEISDSEEYDDVDNIRWKWKKKKLFKTWWEREFKKTQHKEWMSEVLSKINFLIEESIFISREPFAFFLQVFFYWNSWRVKVCFRNFQFFFPLNSQLKTKIWGEILFSHFLYVIFSPLLPSHSFLCLI